MKTTKTEREEWRCCNKNCEEATCKLIDDIESLREALCQIIINTEDECDRAIAQAAVEEPT